MVTNVAICGLIGWAIYVTKNLWAMLGLFFILTVDKKMGDE